MIGKLTKGCCGIFALVGLAFCAVPVLLLSGTNNDSNVALPPPVTPVTRANSLVAETPRAIPHVKSTLSTTDARAVYTSATKMAIVQYYDKGTETVFLDSSRWDGLTTAEQYTLIAAVNSLVSAGREDRYFQFIDPTTGETLMQFLPQKNRMRYDQVLAGVSAAVAAGHRTELMRLLRIADAEEMTSITQQAEKAGYYEWAAAQPQQATPTPQAIAAIAPVMTYQQPQQRTQMDRAVYVTEHGKKYHSAGCRHARNAYAITYREAISSGYTACSRCSG